MAFLGLTRRKRYRSRDQTTYRSGHLVLDMRPPGRFHLALPVLDRLGAQLLGHPLPRLDGCRWLR